MKDKVTAFVQKHTLLLQGGHILVGFSGGADSVALLHFLWENAGMLQIDVAACHINHGIRGAEAKADEAFCKAFCAQRNIPLTTCFCHIPSLAKQQNLSLEECARNERYRLLAETAAAWQSKLAASCAVIKIATAHTLTDSLETVLLNLTRGTGLRGLCGIPAQRDNIIRPLLACTRAEIEGYCAAQHLSFVTDSTNLDDSCTRNKIRHHVLPVLRDINPQISDTIFQTTAQLRQEEDYLSKQAHTAYVAALCESGLAVGALQALHPALLARVMVVLLAQNACPVSAGAVQRLVALVEQGKGAVQMGKRCVFGMRGDVLGLLAQPQTPLAPFWLPVRAGCFPLLPGRNCEILLIDCKSYKLCEKISPEELKNALDYDRIEGTAIIRSRLSGDSFALPLRKVSKSLKKLFIEDKIPAWERGRLAVLADAQGIAWVQGYGSCPRTEVTPATTRALMIKITEDVE